MWRNFHGPNAGYVLELYDRYRKDPNAVDATTRAYFDRWTPPVDGAPAAPTIATEKIVGVVELAHSIRAFGHLAAQIDPLGSPPRGDPALELATHALTEEDLRHMPASLIRGPAADEARNALEVIQALRAIYSSTIGYGLDHIHVPEERHWLRNAAESGSFRPPRDPMDLTGLLERLTQVEVFERFLHRMLPGRTRFSIEGLDMMVPILDEVIGEAAEAGIRSILIGMAHRGRLNVLAHTLKKPYAQILGEFKDPTRGRHGAMQGDVGWTGDVKYHAGARRAIPSGEPIDVVVTLAPNPSHVEAVNPVVQGMARAAGTRVEQPGEALFDPAVTLPILIHGDAAFPGQGIVAETLNYSRLPGFHAGGTIHIIANNQLGFTTSPRQAYGTLYASDLAKGFEIPIVHVNADDPEACIEAARLAFAYRAEFHKDFLIDVIGYRRHGHNEGDEPDFTQPLMYAKIRNHPTVRERWATILVERGLVEKDWPETLMQRSMQELQSVLESLRPEEAVQALPIPSPPNAAPRVKTAVPGRRLREVNEALLRVPDGFTLHPKIERAMERRRKALDDVDASTVDWALAEALAFATILEDGVSIRMTGQDVERGAFSQRHAIFHDVKTERTFIPLQALPGAKAAFEIRNTPLSENAALGFEYGYNVQQPGRLLLWEAQYGDFINGAQVVVDEFIVSARAKWGQTPSLILLLPHGYEGQGPNHSSGRLERFLNLATETNVRIANCTTAAQFFHLLRRQAALLQTAPLPLVVMTPKSLLRHPHVASSLRELSEGGWRPVIDDAQARQQPALVHRLILCSGKVYIDLVTSEHREKHSAIAIARIEQLHPFPVDDVKSVLDGYPNLEEVVWLQEEPENMGAWAFLRPYLAELASKRCPLRYISRPRSSSPAEGSSAWHALSQKALIEQAYTLTSGAVPR